GPRPAARPNGFRRAAGRDDGAAGASVSFAVVADFASASGVVGVALPAGVGVVGGPVSDAAPGALDSGVACANVAKSWICTATAKAMLAAISPQSELRDESP